MRSKRALAVLGSIALLIGCQTAGNVESPIQDYFLKYIGNEGSQVGVDMEITTDGSFVVLGTTKKISDAGTQLLLAKLDGTGKLLWTKEFGDPSRDEEAIDVELTSDGRIIVLANTYVSGSIAAGGSRDILVMTLTADGSIIKNATLTYNKVVTLEDTDDAATSITQTNDGFVIAGSTDALKQGGQVVYQRMALIIRLNDDLTQYSGTWADPPAFSQTSESVSTKIFQLPSGNFYVFGYAKWDGAPTSDFNLWYFSLGPAGGDPNDDVGYFPIPNSNEILGSVAQVPTSLGGGFLLGGITSDAGGNDDLIITRLRSPLDFKLSDPNFGPRSLGYTLKDLKKKTVSVCVSATSGYFVLANEASSGNSNILLTKIDPTGREVWQSPNIRLYGGIGDDFAGAVRELPDGKIVVFGTMSIGAQSGDNAETKMVLIKVNDNGQFAK